MLTVVGKITNMIDVLQFCKDYTFVFHKLYNNWELSEDKAFQKELREKHNLDSWFFQSCKTEVAAKIAQLETRTKKKSEQLDELLALVKVEGKRNRWGVFKKINRLKKAITSDITFGGRDLLKRISFLSNNKKTNEKEIEKLKAEYHKKRIMPITISGEFLKKGNRKFEFDFMNKTIFFKPEKGVRIPIKYTCGKNQQKLLEKLQSQIGEQAITVRLNNDKIWIVFDEQKLYGFAFNETEYNKEARKIPKENKVAKKAVGTKYRIEQKERQLFSKNENRALCIDLNPEHIGMGIIEKQDGEKDKVLLVKHFYLGHLSTKLGLSTTDTKQFYQNDKRKHEIKEIWKQIFIIAIHYNVGYCFIEELFFKDNTTKKSAKEGNRKCKNIWHRELTTRLIEKHCNILGIVLEGVKAMYSSFIGNIQNNYSDSVNAAIEIGRRGFRKYLKGSIYPTISRTDLDTMSRDFGLDVLNNAVKTWISAFNLFKTVGLRYRRELKCPLEYNLKSHKSLVILYDS